jgi:hypothetical protein
VAHAAGRARSQRFRVTSALKKGPRAASAERAETSAGRAETGRQGETSGESCRTSQGPAVPRDECGRKRISHLGRRLRESARRKSQTLGGAQYKRREGIRGRPIAAGRPDAEVAFSGNAIKEAERFGILQSGRFEHPYGGNCTAGTVQGHQAGRATRAALNLSTPT